MITLIPVIMTRRNGAASMSMEKVPMLFGTSSHIITTLIGTLPGESLIIFYLQ
jgi:hypothetical protein